MIAENVAEDETILKVAPGPSYLAIELAKLGKYTIVGLDSSGTSVEIAQKSAAKQAQGQRWNFDREMPHTCRLTMKRSISSVRSPAEGV
ncbi:MAG TPA: class I SAM-dependent methyltransferase [Candidatus Bathyarchaeia archaeon]|nr:class I SAM-dependent methyltransferase [Candidatus Bathyarchaeia archaeon]HYC20605.1 class I SAM-dependent methyltransferase [Candidatus Bathyarchaeia archaeon]